MKKKEKESYWAGYKAGLVAGMLKAVKIIKETKT